MFSHRHWPETSITPSVQVSVSLQVFVMRLCWDVTDQRSIRLNIHVWSAAGMLQDSFLNIYGSFVIDQRSGCWIFKAETDRLIINNVTEWGGLADWSVSISTAIDEKLLWLKKTQGGHRRAAQVALQWMHHHMTASDASTPITELVAEEGAELHRSELQHLKVKLETWK